MKIFLAEDTDFAKISSLIRNFFFLIGMSRQYCFIILIKPLVMIVFFLYYLRTMTILTQK
jgi:hypothetical protein